MEKRHYAVIDPYPRKLKLTYNRKIVVESEKALILKEVGKTVYNPVFYFPKEDIIIELSPDEQRSSSCPIKGEASYWKLAKNPTRDYFAWSYEDALPRAKKIKGYIAFNTDLVSICSEPLQ